MYKHAPTCFLNSDVHSRKMDWSWLQQKQRWWRSSYVVRKNNQHPSELIGSRLEGGRSTLNACMYVATVGGGVGQWSSGSWNLAFHDALCLMGGREVNSTAQKLYLIFIHMNAQGRDRLPQTNWNACDRGGPRRRKTAKVWGVGKRACVYEFLRVYKNGGIHWYGWKDTNHSCILISCIDTHAPTSII